LLHVRQTYKNGISGELSGRAAARIIPRTFRLLSQRSTKWATAAW